MKNIIIVCEGQSEQVFIRNLISRKLDLSKVSFGCLKLQGQKEEQVPYEHNGSDSLLKIIILNVQNDERVLSVIMDRYKYFNTKYDLIIGLRDMYSEGYPDTKVNEIENNRIKKNIKKQTKKFDTNKKVRFFFMVMEFESWLLSLKTTLEEYIFNQSSQIPALPLQPEKSYRPSHVLKSILGNYNIPYGKHFGEVESILSHFQEDDLNLIFREGNSTSFELFLKYCLRYSKGFLIS